MRDHWITGDQMRSELDRSGVVISASRLERWRREKLLPAAKQIGLGRGRGSVVVVPPDSARQALEIDRLYKVREKRDWVGWQLWMQGYWVGEQYWRAPMEGARAAFGHVARQARRYEHRSDISDSDLPALRARARSLARGTPFAAPLARIDEPMFETLLGVGSRLITGQFDGFNWDADEANEDRRAVINMLGTANAERQSIGGNKLAIAKSIEAVLEEIAIAVGRLMRRRSINEPPREERREIAQAFEVVTGLYDMVSPLIGRSALGLRTANWIGRNPDIAVHSAMLLVWGELRAILHYQNGIAELHGETVRAQELAAQLLSAFGHASREDQARILAELKKTIPIPKGGSAPANLRSISGN